MINLRHMAKIDDVAVSAIKKAGALLLKEFGKFDRKAVHFKAHKEFVTSADLKSEKIIIREIKKYFPDHRILSEEKGGRTSASDYLWIIDPMDGTTNFTMHNPLFSISVGLAFREEIIAGFIYAPYMEELFTAVESQPAKLNGRKVSVSAVTGNGALHAFCSSHEKEAVRKAVGYYSKQRLEYDRHCRLLGSAAIELAYVASGRLESIIIPGAKAWDIAAGVAMVRQAGGKVTDFEGKNWTLNSPDLAASNGKVHKQVLQALEAVK